MIDMVEHNDIRANEHSWTMATEEEFLEIFGTQVINDASESPYGSVTDALDKFKMINLANSGGLSLVRQNGCFNKDAIFSSNEEKGVQLELVLAALTLIF